VFSAIVIVAPEIRDAEEDSAAGDATTTAAISQEQAGTDLATVEVLGRSVLARLAEELRRAGVEEISTFESIVDRQGSSAPRETWSRANEQWMTCRQSGAEATLIIRVGAYVEWDFRDALLFHSAHGRPITRAFDREEPLDLWIVDLAQVNEETDLLAVLGEAEPARYVVRGYVNRLEHPKDLRRLVVDALTSRCGLRPQGTEVRPGIWLDEGAEVDRDARLVAPAFIGRGSVIEEQCLITRCSSVESNCQIDYGTVVEDSSILPNTYVGIGLDLSHSIVDGSDLMNLEREVSLEIADPCVIRQNRLPRQTKNFRSPARFGFGSLRLSSVEDGTR